MDVEEIVATGKAEVTMQHFENAPHVLHKRRDVSASQLTITWKLLILSGTETGEKVISTACLFFPILGDSVATTYVGLDHWT